jgi:hypothetical protein
MISDERRRHARAKVSIPVKWGTAPNCGYEGVIAILSLGGCLIKTRLQVSLGQAVFVRMSPDGEGRDASVLRGHVKYEMEGIGLGVKFAGLSAEEERIIRGIMDLRTEK